MPSPGKPRFSQGWLVLVGLGWIAAVLGGFAILLDFQWSSGPTTAAPRAWPGADSIALDATRPTLVLFAHPRCPCTLATIEELDRIAAHCREQLRIVVFLLEAPGIGHASAEEGAGRRAARIPGVEVRADPDGSIARSFHAGTSGHAFLYSADGRLLFDGGITGSRGHVGDNAGASAIVAWVQEGASRDSETPVYGCPLSQDPASEREPEAESVPGSP